MIRRVVITGLGTINPIGNSVQESWEHCLSGKSGIGPLTRIASEGIACTIAGEVKNFNPDSVLSPKEQKKVGRFVHLAMQAGTEAFEDSNLDPNTLDPLRMGTYVGVGMGGLPEIEQWHSVALEKGPKRITPFFIPMVIANMAAGMLSIKYGAKGPNICTATACTSSAHALGESFRLIQNDKADIMIAGGSESVLCVLAFAGFSNMKALSTRNDQPEKASRPFDRDRDGFIMGEGSAILILEEREHALKRGAKIYGEIIGYGISGDAYHMTSPSLEGKGGFQCMKSAIEDAGITANQIGYINAHGTSTPAGDIAEANAIKNLIGENNLAKLHVSSTKSMTGHLLGAAGAMEALFSILALRDQVIPPTINVENQDPGIKFNVTANQKVNKSFEYALSNSFGFGGTNGCLAFRKV